MRSLIIGGGEIGSALFKVLESRYPTWIEGKHSESSGDPEILHICFGFSEEFIPEVKRYQALYQPKYTCVHSTTPVGTCKALGATHSPVIGQHPFLEEGIRTFSKMLGGPEASELADYFRRAGVKVTLFDKSETTEAAKLFLTEYYRECINFAKRVKTYAENYDLSFHEIYTVPNQIYNRGYKELGFEEFLRPILQPIMTATGGHCVEPNKELIKLSE